MSRYLAELHAQGSIDDGEYQALLPTGVLSPEELYAVTLHFPSLADALPSGNVARISSLSAQKSTSAFRNSAMARLGSPAVFAKGAAQPPNAPFPVGSTAGAQSKPPFTAAAVPPPPRIDHHSAWRGAGWRVRDQGQRGTCVAHAMAACKEVLSFNSTHLPTTFDGSEQFLFWGAKQFDPSPLDGTLHQFALQAMQSHGLCDESNWPYVALPAGGTVHQGPPPPTAVAAAAMALHAGGRVTAPSNAALLYAQLQTSSVAIGVPVFSDPLQPANDNWNVGGLLDFGRVLDPQPRTVVTGGHAVCVVGFEPDPAEPAGKGWFIIRNSWGTAVWGSKLPAGGYWAPEPGYGQISWSYVDSYLWEMCWL